MQTTMNHAPNQLVARVAPGDTTTWTQLAFTPPGLISEGRIRSRSAAQADGSGFEFLLNQASAPAGATKGKRVSGSGQTEIIPGGFWNVWVRTTDAATDIVELEMFY